MELLRAPLDANPGNSVIAFKDNSSGIRGYRIRTLMPEQPGQPGRMVPAEAEYHVIFTAETHNFPSGVAPFPGAETGTGGRIRDVHAAGRGSLVVAGTAAYCVGNLYIPGYELPWEDPQFAYPSNLATPLEIEIEASNGASDYGNKFGEPMIQGYTRSFGMRLPDGERREWIKPIMFSGGIGQIDARHTEKDPPEPGMWVVKIGGPAYRKYDLEAWMPGRGDGGEWGEVTSTSNCTDYQARRLNIRYKEKDKKGTHFVHSLNGTAFALSRALIAILENHQNADGSVTIPDCLRPFFGKDTMG